MKVLVTGATGYVGGRLVPELLQAGHTVRCVVRTPQRLDDVPWRAQVDVVAGDMEDSASLVAALEGIEAAYYLVHAIGTTENWRERDRRYAQTFAAAAAQQQVDQIVYLGGLGDDRQDLSEHLASRHEVGRVLAQTGVAVTEVRAAVVIGSGSASFEMLRHLADVLPVMVTPRWVRTRCQPIAVRDVLNVLVRVLEHPQLRGQVLEAGGPDILTYEQMLQQYADVAGLYPRRLLVLPLLTPRLSSLWVGLVTPLPVSLARALIGSLSHEVIVNDPTLAKLIPSRVGYREAVELALRRLRTLEVPTTWLDAGGVREPGEPVPWDPDWSGGTILRDQRTITVHADASTVFRVVQGVGGARGWYGSNLLWGLRGTLDAVLGGVGRRRTRRHPEELRIGDAVDSWRVQDRVVDRLLRLRAEMRLPGRAWLEWELEPSGQATKLTQRAVFVPRGLAGRVYWYLVLPFHALLFPRLIKGLARAAVQPAPPTQQR